MNVETRAHNVISTTKLKCSYEEWVDVVLEAHELNGPITISCLLPFLWVLGFFRTI
jgi:hypothetical protein